MTDDEREAGGTLDSRREGPIRMTIRRAQMIVFVGLGLLAFTYFAQDALENMLPYGYYGGYGVRDFVRDGGFKGVAAVIIIVGAYFWLTRRGSGQG